MNPTDNNDTLKRLLDPQARDGHTQIIGLTGSGKSRLLAQMIKHDIQNNNGLCLIDPHGHLYADMVKWCETRHLLDEPGPKKILLFDPHDDSRTLGLNPLQVDDPADISDHAEAMSRALAGIWSGDTDLYPILKRNLRLIFHILAANKLALPEVQNILDPKNITGRNRLIQEIADPLVKQEWGTLNSMKSGDFYQNFGSTINRMMELLSSPAIRTIFSQSANTVNFTQILTENSALLANLAVGDLLLGDYNVRLLGALILNDLFLKASARTPDSRPFYLYIDECSLFAKSLFPILEEGRKFNLCLILTLQSFSQLKQAGEDAYQTVLANTKTKVGIGRLSPEDSQILSQYT